MKRKTRLRAERDKARAEAAKLGHMLRARCEPGRTEVMPHGVDDLLKLREAALITTDEARVWLGLGPVLTAPDETDEGTTGDDAA